MDKQYINSTDRINLDNYTSDMAGKVPTTRQVNSKALSVDINLSKSDVGLGNVDNTSDASKPVSTATQTALNTKLNTPAGTTGQYMRGDGTLASFPSIPTGTITSITAGTGLSGGTITYSGTISMPNVGTAGTYSGTTTDAQGRVTSGVVRSFSYPTRLLNTAYQPSATQDCLVVSSIDIACTISLTTGQTGTVILEIADDSGFTTNVKTLQSTANGNTGTLTVGLNLTQTATASVCGVVPIGKYYRIRSVNTTGTPTFTMKTTQEVLL